MDSEIFPWRVNFPEELHSSWLIDSMVNIGNSFGRTVEISVEIWTLVVFSV